jgi:hypothetical protein
MSKKMCKLAKKDDLEKAAKRAKGAKYICEKCLRAAKKPDHLCKPKKC